MHKVNRVMSVPTANVEDTVGTMETQVLSEEVQLQQEQVVSVSSAELYDMIGVEAIESSRNPNIIQVQIDSGNSGRGPEQSFDTLAAGLLDEIVDMEQGPSKQAAQTYEAIAQNLIEEVVKHSPPNHTQTTPVQTFGDQTGSLISGELIQSNSNQFSPPQSMQGSIYSPAQLSYHSSPSGSIIHMSPASQYHQSPAHSIHSVHSIYSPASCHAYPNQSPIQGIAISPRQTLQIVPENPLSNVSMNSNHDQMQQQNYVVIEGQSMHGNHVDHAIHLSPEQVQQVASLHNTPLHNTDGNLMDNDRQDGNLMDELVRNLILNNSVVDSQAAAELNSMEFNSCVVENNSSNNYHTNNEGMGAQETYTSPIRNDVFLHQSNMVSSKKFT